MLAKLVICWRFLKKWGLMLLCLVGGVLLYPTSPENSGNLFGMIPVFLLLSPDFFQSGVLWLGRQVLQATKNLAEEERQVLGGLIFITGILIAAGVGMLLGLGIAAVQHNFAAGLLAGPGFIAGLLILNLGGAVTNPAKFSKEWNG